MSVNKTYQYYQSLPPWARGVAVVGMLGVVTIVGFKIYKGIKDRVDKNRLASAVKDTKKELDALTGQGQKATFPDSQYQAFANTLQNQFAGCDWSVGIMNVKLSDSGEVLKGICEKLNNNVDFLKLVYAYGVRTYDQCGTWPFAGDFTGDIYKAVNDELDNYEIRKINEVLAKKGITYKF